ncbi:pectin methylesterase [Plasmopara halstedii]|uniref:Pectinesterase n=1 Tax=Plasmopara halstedii TaxID=4781 RepID=A0A0P1APP8_PLAHL|nr:pectin methylesterase [Plasmopara halstedii]CEG43066.1 pectin methylesterase [Plasmopara halstedii]|eukprot:XP_024579435.1 pectin methylesterase [Plasmopara halstedii]
MRHFSLPLAVFATLVSPLIACEGPHAKTCPNDPDHSIVVDQSGAYPGSYKTVKEGVANLSQMKSNLFIYPGEYLEQVVIPSGLTNVTVQGFTCDTTTYALNTVTITHAKAQRDLPANETNNRNFQTSTLGIKADQFKMYNINVANTAGPIRVNGQGVAVFASGKDHGFYACSFTGYQDTFAASNGRILIVSSHISGTVDFIFGQKGLMWAEKCDIEVLGDGWITANGNNNWTRESEFVFNRATVYGIGRTFLGRPWRPYSRCIWQNSFLGEVVDPQGWSKWNDDSVDNVFYREFNNQGLGATMDQRVSFSGLLGCAMTIEQLLGNVVGDFIYDSRFM